MFVFLSNICYYNNELMQVASSIRSNGVINAGFIVHFGIHSVAQAYYTDLGVDDRELYLFTWLW